MLNWIKGLFSSKTIIKTAIDSLDLADPYLAGEIIKIEKSFQNMTPIQQSNWIIDKVQKYLLYVFKIEG